MDSVWALIWSIIRVKCVINKMDTLIGVGATGDDSGYKSMNYGKSLREVTSGPNPAVNGPKWLWVSRSHFAKPGFLRKSDAVKLAETIVKILPKTFANISCHALQPLRQPLRHWLRFWLPQYFSRAGPFARNRSEPKVGFGSTPTSEIAPISLVEREIYSSLLVFPHAGESIASDPRHPNLNSP